MRRSNEIGDKELEQLLAGRGPSAGRELDDLAHFIGEAKKASSITPSPALEQRHISAITRAAQLNIEKGKPVARPASKALGPVNQVSGLPNRRRKLVFSSLLTSLVAKIVATGMALAAATTGGMALTGNLPDEVQTKLSAAADTVGIQIPTGDDLVQSAEDELEGVEDDVDADLEVTVDDDEGDLEEGDDGGDNPQGGDPEAGKRSNFDVHEAINSTEPGPERGKAVSEAARQKPGDEELEDGDQIDDSTETTVDEDEGSDSKKGQGNAFGHGNHSNSFRGR
jgi:hypothetical protein